MASETTTTSRPTPAPHVAKRTWRRRWQVPTFLAGLLSLAAVWLGRPYLHRPAPAPSLDREIAAVREALDPPHRNLPRALEITQTILDRANLTGEQRGQIHFLRGTAFLGQAGTVPVDQAGESWRKAREHLEEAAALGVPPEDRLRLDYRLALAWFHTEVELERVIERLLRSVERGADDPAEGYGVLAQAYLRLPTPDLASALEANRKQLALATDNDERLAPIRLLRGELLLQAHEGKEARLVLARIGHDAAKEVYVRARLLRAQSCQKDHLWRDAIPLWEEILKDTSDPGDPGRALYFLGVCYRRVDRPRDARRVWEKALGYEPEVAQAAALGLADLELTGMDPTSALGHFQRAVREVARLADYHNQLVSQDEARAVFERGCRSLHASGDYPRALRLAQLFERIAAPGVAQEWIARAAEDWAQDCLARAGQVTGAPAERLREEARAKFQEAAAAQEALAKLRSDSSDQVATLFHSVDDYLHGAAADRALGVLQRLIAAQPAPEVLGQAWFQVAEVHRLAGRAVDARQAYHKCIEFPGPFAFRARFRLAKADIDKGRWADAEAALKQNLDLMRGDPDDEAYENTLLALAELEIKQGNHRLAALRLQEALDRYPASAAALTARQQLAACYRRLAVQEEQNQREPGYRATDARHHSGDQRRLCLQKAEAHYQKLVDDLASRPPGRSLTEAEDKALRQAAFAAAECRFELGDYAGAIQLYEELAVRYRHQVDALAALKQMTRCYWVQRDPARANADDPNWIKAGEVIGRARAILQGLSDSAFQGRSDLPSRTEWEHWLDWAAQQ
jgi:tetratricopeptide (TPR) repeat protein